MSRYVAFLRGMNVGGHRITNDQLCANFAALGYGGVSAFLASGNLVFDSDVSSEATLTAQIETRLYGALGYQVPVFLRTGSELIDIAAQSLFIEDVDDSVGSPQVAFLKAEQGSRVRDEVLEHATEADLLHMEGRQLYWKPRLGFSNSELDLKSIEALVGSMTIRTKRTVDRIAAKFLTS
jgi:uncharacterized protein (DUF1697 family)